MSGGGAASAAIQAFGQLLSGVASMESGKFNRKVAKTNAVNALRDGEMEAARIRDRARLAMGEQIGRQAASGFEVGTGSSLDALRESAVEAELDQMLVRRRAAMAAQAHRTQGKIAYAQGYNAMVAGHFGAAGTIDNYAAQRRMNADQGGGGY